MKKLTQNQIRTLSHCFLVAAQLKYIITRFSGWVLNNQMKIDGLYHFYEAKDHLSHEKIIKLLNINRFICQLTVLFRQKKMKWRIICSWQSSEIFNNTSINYNYKFTWYILSESTCVVSYQWPVLTPVPIRDINISCRTCLSLVVK